MRGGGESLESGDCFEGYEFAMEELDIKLDALSAMYGLMSRDAFREKVRGALEKWFGIMVERRVEMDEEGIVYLVPSDVEIDIIAGEEEVILLEIAPEASEGSIAALMWKAKLYERKTGIKPSKLALFAPYVSEKALRLISQLGIEVYRGVRVS